MSASLNALRAAGSADVLLNAQAAGSGARLPMNMNTVNSIAEKYGLDISDLKIVLAKGRVGYYGVTSPKKVITFTRDAFRNEEQLARTIYHEQYHVNQIESGMGYPETRQEAGPWEQDAEQAEESWWQNILDEGIPGE